MLALWHEKVNTFINKGWHGYHCFCELTDELPWIIIEYNTIHILKRDGKFILGCKVCFVFGDFNYFSFNYG